jgi:DNA polymerase III subunit delta'
MDHLVLHPRTKDQVAQFVSQPGHATLLVGSNGIGKTSLARSMIEAALRLEAGKLDQHPYVTVISPEKDSISIDSIRQLQRFLQLKTLGTEPLRRAVIVEHAEALTTEAQNAYLKLLEEPPADTVMILTADNQRALLPTMLSRVQTISLNAPDEDTLKGHFAAAGKDAAAINQAFFLSGGLPGLMHALLDEDSSHPLVSGVSQAKEILQKQQFERLTMVEGLSKQRDEARYVVQALQHIAQTCLSQAATKGDEAKLRQWHRILQISTEAEQALGQSANTKLVLSNLMLRI